MHKSSDAKSLLHYNPARLLSDFTEYSSQLEGFSNWYLFFNKNIPLIDRSGVLKAPFRTQVFTPIPKFEVCTQSYSEICDQRASEILKLSDETGRPIHVLYSGGIDSTLILVALLKQMNESQKQRLVVLLSSESISEYPDFYYRFLRDKVELRSALKVPYQFDDQRILLCGEFNDQLYGSVLLKDLIINRGSAALHRSYSREDIQQIWPHAVDHRDDFNQVYDRLEKMVKSAPVEIVTNAEFLWWVNFSLKWQAVQFRLLMTSSKWCHAFFNKDYFSQQFVHFFDTTQFQLWAMNRNEPKIDKTWSSYKYLAKQYIHDMTGDRDYLKHKTKVGSLYHVVLHQAQWSYFFDDFTMADHCPESVWNDAKSSVS